MTAVIVPDLRTGFPRSGRAMLGGYAWVARLADKARAHKAGLAGDYVAYCPLSLGFLEHLRVPRQDFEARVDSEFSDGALVEFLNSRVSEADRQAANRWMLDEHAQELDEQDREEGRK